MSHPLDDAERARVLALSADEQYRHFIERALADGEVWTLRGPGGFVAYRGEDGEPCFPFWPHPDYALALANDDWSDCRPEPLPLDRFMDRWLPGMARDGRQLAVFPTPAGQGLIADPQELLDDLVAARERADPTATGRGSD
ncbi:DUF2750 domain-containing protein [Thiococcus pfennigii]|uniref:DUF2750 domain-containing protein n=1 Tax=Thiococcus pfennigii TaxID=1057 RepID=UPI00190885DB|nr:DUF2750 domain-containing protein [Thiococcus pfennigii]MBK1701485.1 hypothetical protein [Thiococcus pfennigii]